MSMKLSHEMFAEKGDQWNTPNYQHPSRPRVRLLEPGDTSWDPGHRLPRREHRWDVDGYDRPDPRGPKRVEPRPVFRERAAPIRPRDPERVARVNAALAKRRQERPAEYRDLRGQSITGKEVPLTPAQLRVRDQQLAQEAKREARAKTRLQRRERERKAAIKALLALCL